VFSLVSKISSISILFPFASGLYVYKNLKDLRLFWYFITFCVFFELLSGYYAFYGRNNLFLINIYTVIELVAIAFSFRAWIENEIFKKFIPWVCVLFIITWTYLTYINGIIQFNDKATLYESLIILSLSGYFLISYVSKAEHAPFRDSKFWISSGIFIYFATTMILFSSLLFIKNPIIGKYFGFIHVIINFFINLIFFIGFLCRRAKTI